MIGRYAKSEDSIGLVQVFTTLVPFTVLWWASMRLINTSFWVALLPLPFIILLTVRVFGLMHECGHGSLFRSRWLNRLDTVYESITYVPRCSQCQPRPGTVERTWSDLNTRQTHTFRNYLSHTALTLYRKALRRKARRSRACVIKLRLGRSILRAVPRMVVT